MATILDGSEIIAKWKRHYGLSFSMEEEGFLLTITPKPPDNLSSLKQDILVAGDIQVLRKELKDVGLQVSIAPETGGEMAGTDSWRLWFLFEDLSIEEARRALSLLVRSRLGGYHVRAGTDTIYVSVSRQRDKRLFPGIFAGYPVEFENYQGRFVDVV